MAGQVRRFNPSHQWIHNKIKAGELTLQQLDAQTYFFRRTNANAKGEPRSWTDQFDMKIQMAGLPCSSAVEFQRGETNLKWCSIIDVVGAQITATHSINYSKDHISAHKLIAERVPIELAQISDCQIMLRDCLAESQT